MVFQQGQPINLWGFVPSGVHVTVTLQPLGTRASAVGDASGRWSATLPAIFAPGGPYTITASAGGNTTSLLDVLLGTVLLCGGQSNLSGATTPVSYSFNATNTTLEASSFPWVRIFTVGEQATQGLLPPQAQLGYAPRQPWAVASSANVAGFSGACWMTAKVLARTLGAAQPLGLIESAWSGTCIQAWLPAGALASCGAVPPAQGWQTNSTLYNQMVAPFAGLGGGGLAVAGFIYYQGESNAIYYQPGYYECALAALFSSWRAAFRNPAAWFGVVQIAPWTGFGTLAFQAAGVRAAEQAVTLADAHATLATAIDLGDVGAPQGSIHPRQKQTVGARLAAGALADLFGVSGGATAGPVYAAAVAGGGAAGRLSATVSFAPPYAGAGALVLANVSAWPGLAPASRCPGGGAICAGFELQDAATGQWWGAAAALNRDASALILEAPGAPAGAVANATSNGFAVWPQVELFGAPALGALPAYTWRRAL